MIDVTGVEIYLVGSAVVTTTKADCATAIAAGKKLIKAKSFGDVGGTRAVTEHVYLAEDSEKSLGTVSYGNIPVEMPFNGADTAGQAEMKAIFTSKAARKIVMKETNGDYTVIPVKCSVWMKSYAVNDFVMFKGTLEQNGAHSDVIA